MSDSNTNHSKATFSWIKKRCFKAPSGSEQQSHLLQSSNTLSCTPTEVLAAVDSLKIKTAFVLQTS
jgi:hypothetical protein